MIDFSNAVEEFNNYRGSEKKKTLIYNNKKYLVKFPDPIREKNKNISYINNAFSEYIGSSIFKMSGFDAQNTLLGTYNYNGREKIVCACEDFTNNENMLYEFENLALSTNPDKKIETEVKDIMEVIDESRMIDINETKKQFWRMFIIDAIIGNTDRHNGNWGFLVNKVTGKISFAPIYDCGSCLNPIIEDVEIEKINDTELKNLAINSYSCLKENGKKINYMAYIKKMENSECNEAIKDVFNKKEIEKIMDFIDDIACISKTRKEFYKAIINQRYKIIEEIYTKLQ